MNRLKLFELDNFTYFYPGSETPALKNINLELQAGQIIVIAGLSGSGKTSLVRALTGLVPQYYGGKVKGKAMYRNRPLASWSFRNLAQEIGILQQEAENQLVFSSVERELAFGLENLGVSPQKMASRLAEVVDFLSLQPLLCRKTEALSGGEKQRVALGGILAMHPRVLVLDEPTAGLDPLVADQLLQTLQRLNHEWGLTIIIVEQNLGRCFHLADTILVMEQGEVLRLISSPQVSFGEAPTLWPVLPPVARFFSRIFEVTSGTGLAGLESGLPVPLSIREGRALVAQLAQQMGDFGTELIKTGIPEQKSSVSTGRIEARKLWFKYRDGPYVVKNVSACCQAGEITAVMGGNGAGKSTLLQLLGGIHQAKRGNLRVDCWTGREVRAEKMAGTVGYLSQNPNDYLWKKTVQEEVLFTPELLKKRDPEWLNTVTRAMDLKALWHMNPRQLSMGERMRVAIASVLSCRPGILLLDEPTRAFDSTSRERLAKLLTDLAMGGASIVLATHDTEFVAEYADRVLLMHEGTAVSTGSTREVLGESMFYAPAACRVFRGINDLVFNWKDGQRWVEEVSRSWNRECS